MMRWTCYHSTIRVRSLRLHIRSADYDLFLLNTIQKIASETI
jgi:hypothetical protein